MPDKENTSTNETYPIGNTNEYKEGTSITTKSDGTIHQTDWYSNNSSSWRTSTDYDRDGNPSDKHTKKNR